MRRQRNRNHQRPAVQMSVRELKANQAYVVLQHCVELGLSDEECVAAAKLMLK